MIRSELIQKIADENPHLYQRDVENIVNTIFEEITGAMSKGDRVELRGFGAFSVKKREARMGRNPRTGESDAVEQKLRYAFWAIVALGLILVGLANRGIVTVQAMPVAFSDLLGLSPNVDLPLFVVIFLSVGAGLLIGFVWEWIREYRQRAQARAITRELQALRRELAALKSSGAPKRDDVLALLEA